MRPIRNYFITILAVAALTICVTAAASAADLKSASRSEIDVAGKDDGYIQVHSKVEMTKRLKVKTIYEASDGTKIEYAYDLNGTCAWETYPLQSGDGKYTIQVLENVDGSRYTVIQTETVTVTYSRENAPFLVPAQSVNYSIDSEAVKKAAELCEGAETELGQVESIYKYVVETVTYDYDKAKQVTSGGIMQYIPVVDDTLKTSKGICFDFSSLMAAMLRSQGIPTKLTMGYVTDTSGTIYHAWNEVYIKDVGWVRIRSSIYFDGQAFERMDATFASGNRNGRKTTFMGDDSNYKKNKEY